MDISPNTHAARQTDAAVLVFGPFTLHRASQQLLKGGQAVRIGSRAFSLLVDLVESAGQLRTRQQLEARVWPRSVVEETSLRVHMSALRRVLGDGRDGARYIANVPGCGYSFIAKVTSLGAAQALPAPAALAQPAPPHPHLIGRAADIQSLTGQCAHTRLLAIVGPGGIGKTALALAVADMAAGRFADGVLFVDLDAAAEQACVASMVAEAAAIALPAGGRLQALCAALGQRRLLLVLDNCERALEGAAALAIALIQYCPGVHILATTREPLDVEGERVHWLDALRTPAVALADPRAALAYAAVELFVARARAANDRFVLDQGNAADVCRLCRQLDGIPLAIELAAARAEALGVASLAASLSDLLGLLTRARRTALPRHRTMEAALAWSYQLLDAQEQSVLCRSAIFQGDFSIDAARAVCVYGSIDEAAVARCIESLSAKSLLVRRMEGSAVWYRQLLLTRTYAFAKLDDAEKAGLARRHAQHVLALLARSPAAVAAQAALPWVGAHGRSFEDCRAALDWAFSGQGDPALGIAMTPKLIHTLRYLGLPDDFRRRLMLMLDERGAPRLAPEAAISVYAALAVLGAYSHTEFDLLREIVARIHALLPVVASPVLRFEALVSIGAAAYGMGEAGLMLEVVREQRALAGEAGNPAYALLADRLETSARHFRGEHDAAVAISDRVLRSTVPAAEFGVFSPTPCPVGARWNLARIAWIRGQPALAAQLAHEALAHADQLHPVAQCQTLVIAALPVAIWRGDAEHAAQLTARLQALAASCRSPYWQDWARVYAAALARRGGAVADAPPWPEALAPIARDMLATLAGDMPCAATLARADTGRNAWCAPEVWRTQGESLLAAGDAGQAAGLFLRALALAREQRALGWELRIACSLARSMRATPRAAQAWDMLADTLARFDEGLETADCRAAAALLASRSFGGGHCEGGAGEPRTA